MLDTPLFFFTVSFLVEFESLWKGSSEGWLALPSSLLSGELRPKLIPVAAGITLSAWRCAVRTQLEGGGRFWCSCRRADRGPLCGPGKRVLRVTERSWLCSRVLALKLLFASSPVVLVLKHGAGAGCLWLPGVVCRNGCDSKHCEQVHQSQHWPSWGLVPSTAHSCTKKGVGCRQRS